MLYRAFHVGEKARLPAVFIFTRMLLNIISSQRPVAILGATDVESSSEGRRKMYTPYKKKERDEAQIKIFLEQRALAFSVLEALGIPVISCPEWEADDILATLVRDLYPRSVVFVSSDKDLYQCVSERVSVYDLSKRRLVTLVQVSAEKGFQPHEVVGVLALTGDASDGVPGIRGIGIKTAVKLIRQYETVDSLFRHLDELSSGLRAKLQGKVDQVLLAKQLVTLRSDLPLSYKLLPFCITPEVYERTRTLFSELNFSGEMSGWLRLLQERYLRGES
jgi:DNA polymerase-1